MSKIRVYELAKQINISSKELINVLKKMDVEVANHMSMLDANVGKRVEQYLNNLKPQTKSEPQKNGETSNQQREGQQDRNPSTGHANNQRPRPKSNGNQQSGKRENQHQPYNKNQNQKPSADQRNQNQTKQNHTNQGHTNRTNEQHGKKVSHQQGANNRPSPSEKEKRGNSVESRNTQNQTVKTVKDENYETRGKTKVKSKGNSKRFDDNKNSVDFSNKLKHKKVPQQEPRAPKPLPEKIVFTESMSVGELAKKLGKEPSEIIKKLLFLGIMANINKELDGDTITLIAGEYGVEVEEKILINELEFETIEENDDPANLQERPPVVTIMGHVDHGKTTLLDAIRQASVVSTEAGGITQHIGAYQVEINNKKITFLDTPGHAAFTTMRARGAQVTDLTILVVAADDGVMPQTIEAINHAKAAKVPIIVAVNKMDKPAANPDRVMNELTEHGLVAEAWGGETIFVQVSALQKQGLEDLLEMVLLVAEVQELKANPNKRARGTVIEAELDRGRGTVATVLVQNGTLHVGDPIVVGSSFGRVRAMVNDKGRRIKEAGPSTPVEITGLNDVPQAGDQFMVFEDEKKARSIGEKRAAMKREVELRASARVSLDDLFNQIKEGNIKEVSVIIKGDVQGSVEALRGSLEKIDVEGARVRIIHTGVGAITESDVILASASNAIIIGFNVRPDVNAKSTAESQGVDIRLHRIIYKVMEEIEAAMKGMLEPVYQEKVIGQAEIRQVFKVSKVGNIAGCYVTEGKITRDSGVRVIRDGVVIFEGKLDTLKRFKDDAKEVAQGYECGITVERYNDIKEGDIIEAFIMEEIPAT
ncbi:translation initiation factor IF-2 [Ammoniphilus resinae]|uniref:Translation initiation factor IF-2 n=1 Tax=Ammoniphilus resinae TaxID=861532 RepID=A0ABS4GMN1_9BACL|nr:translation initiation factor IF-2 [Ammoniphilus resinae]MBP1931533.1 translation initiation factor IF-2 [Ammoniphilus resinae]